MMLLTLVLEKEGSRDAILTEGKITVDSYRISFEVDTFMPPSILASLPKSDPKLLVGGKEGLFKLLVAGQDPLLDIGFLLEQ